MAKPIADTQTLARTLNEILILSTLQSGAMHGYQLALEIEERSGGAFTFAHGTLYPILHQLEKEGLIDGRWNTEGVGRRRKEYALTAAGAARLAVRVGEWQSLGDHLSAFLAASTPIRARAASGG
jgi:PadR family transcriptional regulator, regulatory protein PadR